MTNASPKPKPMRLMYPDDLDGRVHHDGQIWSHALRNLHYAIGQTHADTAILLAQFDWTGTTMLAERALRRDERIDHDLRWIGDALGGAYTFAYTAGRRVILPWLEQQGQTAGFTRLLREQLSPGQLRAEIGEPRALYPGSLV